MKKLMIAGGRSGCGKTTAVMGLTRFLKEEGMTVQVYKTGPDYIDPMFHTAVSGRPCINLDPWFLEEGTPGRSLREVFSAHAGGADFLLVEAAMGLCDGITGQGTRGSALAVAQALDLPVLFLADGGDLPGAERYLRELPEGIVRGVIINRPESGAAASGNPVSGSPAGGGVKPSEVRKHLPERLAGIPVLGFLPELAGGELKSRHLGLTIPEDPEDAVRAAVRGAEAFRSCTDTDGIRQIAGGKEAYRIAVARDEAFSFIYEENLQILKETGGEPVFFSPLRDRELPSGVSGLWLPGGYPELCAEALSMNNAMREEIADAVRRGLPTVAECGGFMYLMEDLESFSGETFEMCGVIPGKAFRTPKLQRFGYIVLTAKRDTLLLAEGEQMRAHEFHYWDAEYCGDAVRAEKASGKGAWDCVAGSRTLFAGYPHIYLAGCPKAAERLAEACRAWQRAHRTERP